MYMYWGSLSREYMTDHQDKALQELLRIRKKIERKGEEIKQELQEDPSPTISDKTAGRFDRFIDELQEDLRNTIGLFRGFCEDTSDEACRFYETVVDELQDLRSDVKEKREEITGGVGEKTAIRAIDRFHKRVDEIVLEQKRFPL